MKTHPLITHFQSKNLRPFSHDMDAVSPHIPSLREALDTSYALRTKALFADKISAICTHSIQGTSNNSESTILDIRSSDSLSKEKVRHLRQMLLDPNKLEGRARYRHLTLWVQKKMYGLDMKEYLFTGRPLEQKQMIMLLNEVYQLAVLGMNKDGYTVPADQMNRMFETMEEFDTFVVGLVAEESPSWHTSQKDRYSRIIRCVAVRYMINIFDTLNSEKYRKVVEDREILISKLHSVGLRVSDTGEAGVYRVELPGSGDFRGVITIDEKTFDSINKKKRSNRVYTKTESMADLLRMRFEGSPGDTQNMTNAIAFFSKHLFRVNVKLKTKGNMISVHDIPNLKKLSKTSSKIKTTTASTLSNATLTGNVQGEKSLTDEIEFQFQFEGEMEKWPNSTPIYDLKKSLTAVCRDMGSVDMANILFYIRQLPLEKIGMTEQEVLNDLFLPQSEAHITSSRPLRPADIRAQKDTLSLVAQIWRGEVGFMLPVRTKKWVRFITQMAFSPEMFDLYPNLYAPAPFVEKSPEILKKMVENCDPVVTIRLEDYQDRLDRYESVRMSILAKYER